MKKVNKFAEARKFMSKSLREDGGLRLGYQANVAMWLYDNCKGVTQHNRDELAEGVLGIVFDLRNRDR